MTSTKDSAFNGQYFADVGGLGMPTNVKEYRDFLTKLMEDRKNRAPLAEVGAYHEKVQITPNFTADIATPVGGGSSLPVFLICHGNGGIAGSAHSYRGFTRDVAAAGYMAVTPDYRLGPEHRHPAGIDDLVATALWLRTNAETYGGDGSNLIVCGDSVGAVLAMATVLRLLNEADAPRLRAFVGLEGFYDLSEDRTFIADAYLPEGISDEARKDPMISPVYGIKPGLALPPILLISGSADFAGPATMGFAIELCRNQYPFELHVIEGMIHDFMKFRELDGRDQGHALMFDFLTRHP